MKYTDYSIGLTASSVYLAKTALQYSPHVA